MLFLDLVRNGAMYCLFFTAILVCLIPVFTLLYLPFAWDWVRISFYKIVHTLHWFFLAITFLPLTFNAPEKPLPETAIFVANHESCLDLFMMGRVLKDRKYTMLAKGELLNYPIIGTLVGKLGVPVYFGNSPKRGKAIPLAVDKLNNGISVGLFPEAERFNDGEIHEFKTGFAVMAQQSGKPVVPVFFEGAGKALPSGCRLINWTQLKITVGDPFYMQEGETVKAFTERVRNWFIMKNKLIQK